MKKDVLRDYLERLIHAMQHCETFDEKLARELERQCRQDWAGERPLIRKDPDRELKRHAASQDLRRGESIQQVQAKHGISRSLVYQLLKNRN